MIPKIYLRNSVDLFVWWDCFLGSLKITFSWLYFHLSKVAIPCIYVFDFSLFAIQVLSSHPNYPKIKKDILDKARSSIRIWSALLYQFLLFALFICSWGDCTVYRTFVVLEGDLCVMICPWHMYWHTHLFVVSAKYNMFDRARNSNKMIDVVI